jgi:hypothetical protein
MAFCVRRFDWQTGSTDARRENLSRWREAPFLGATLLIGFSGRGFESRIAHPPGQANHGPAN